MFIGEYTHTIDDKNRLSLPVKFRKEIGRKIIITRGLDGCLFGFTEKAWRSFSERLGDSSSMLQSDTRSFSRYLFGGAVEAEVDSIGRVLVPDFLREHGGLKGKTGKTDKVIVVGVRDRIEIWNEKLWTECRTGVERRADALAEKLGQVGMI